MQMQNRAKYKIKIEKNHSPKTNNPEVDVFLESLKVGVVVGAGSPLRGVWGGAFSASLKRCPDTDQHQRQMQNRAQYKIKIEKNHNPKARNKIPEVDAFS